MIHIFHPKVKKTEIPIEEPKIRNYLNIINSDYPFSDKLDAVKKLYEETMPIVYHQKIPSKKLGANLKDLGSQIIIAKHLIDSVIMHPELKEGVKEAKIILAAQILAATSIGEVIENLKDVITWANET